MDWNLLKTFHEIVRHGGVTSAANAISRQQPAVSGALKRLEDYLGKVLCERGPGGFMLTDYGERVAAVAQELDDLVVSLKSRFDEIDNDLNIILQIATVSHVVSARLDTAISVFAETYPRAELHISVAPHPRIEDLVMSGEADVGICPEPRFDPELEYVFLYRERHQVVCGRSHRLAGRDDVALSDLGKEGFIVPGEDEARLVRNYRNRYGWGRRRAGQSHDIGEVKRLLNTGIGVALLPTDMVQRELADGRFWALTDPLPELEDDVFLVMRQASPRYFAACRFCELLPPADGPGTGETVTGQAQAIPSLGTA